MIVVVMLDIIQVRTASLACFGSLARRLTLLSRVGLRPKQANGIRDVIGVGLTGIVSPDLLETNRMFEVSGTVLQTE